MDRTEAHRALCAAVAGVAPDADAAALDPDDDLIDGLGLDSMDMLGIAEAIQVSTTIVIPERDYPKLRSTNQFVDYLVSHAG